MSSIRLMRADGFTIIEVMLFLAVSSLLAVVILGGSSYAINQQRYTDSLNSLHGLLQQQYTETAHVVNGRSTDDESVRCSAAAGGTLETDVVSGGERPGRSECLIMGKVVVFNSDHKTITLANILGIPQGEREASDLAELQRHRYIISTTDTAKSEVAWGGELTMFRGSSEVPAGNAATLVILRSPLTGAIKTFSLAPRADGNLQITSDEDIVQGNIIDTRLCINRDMFSVGPRLGVKVHAGASSSTGVEILADDGGCQP